MAAWRASGAAPSDPASRSRASQSRDAGRDLAGVAFTIDSTAFDQLGDRPLVELSERQPVPGSMPSEHVVEATAASPW